MILGHMVSMNDYLKLTVEGSDFAELILFNGDLEHLENTISSEHLRRSQPPILFLHTQEFFKWRGLAPLVDLASNDDELRSACVDLVERTRSVARSLGIRWVVIHPGGISPKRGDRRELLGNLRKSLDECGPSMLLLENMPWFYWFRKSERMLSNICVTIKDIGGFVKSVEGLTLDTSHGFLSRPGGDSTFCGKFLSTFPKKTMHIHASDARAPDIEGLQIGEGDVNFSFLSESTVPIVVEVWKGHEMNGKGFSLAIRRLRGMEGLWQVRNRMASRPANQSIYQR